MTMIISSSEGDDDDTNTLHVSDTRRNGTDYERRNEGIDIDAGAIHCNGISSTEKDINALICDYGVEHLVHYDASKAGLDEEDFATFSRGGTSVVEAAATVPKPNALSQATLDIHSTTTLHPSPIKDVTVTPGNLENDLNHRKSAYNVFKKDYFELLEKSKNNNTATSVMYSLTKRLLPSLYTRLGSLDGTNKDLQASICKKLGVL